MRRAIALAGGGPALGLHIGVLRRLNEEKDLDFHVWSLSCIGAWVGIVYNQFDEDKSLKKTEEFFRNGVFRNDDSYSRFPINTVFGPDIFAAWRATSEFILNPMSYQNLWLPNEMEKVAEQYLEFCTNPDKWNQGDLNYLILESLSANPIIRYYTSMMFLSNIDGLARIYYPNSSFMKKLEFDKLNGKNKPIIFHNAWNLTKKRLEQFANKPDDIEVNRNVKSKEGELPGYQQLTLQSLCACSALPFIEQTITMNGDTYCEGALVDTVNFWRLLKDHKVDEIWISRIVDDQQVRAPENIHDALANLCQLFAATVGEDDVKLFKMHAKEEEWQGKLFEIEVSPDINFDWTHSNLDRGIDAGYKAASKHIAALEKK